MSENDRPLVDEGGVPRQGGDSVADEVWAVRYSDPAGFARLREQLAPGAQRTILRAFDEWRSQHQDEALLSLADVLDDPTLSHRWRARGLAVRAAVLGELGLLREAFEVRHEVQAEADLSGDLVLQVATINDFGVLYEFSDPGLAQTHYVRVLRAVDTAHALSTSDAGQLRALRALAVLNLHGLVREHGLPLPEETPTIEEVRDGVVDAWPAMAAVLSSMLASAALARGEVAEAARLVEGCEEPGPGSDAVHIVYLTQARARLLAAQGDPGAAIALLQAVLELVPALHAVEIVDTLVEIREGSGDLAGALADAKRLVTMTRTLHGASTAAAVRALEVVYRTDRAEQAAARAEASAARAEEAARAARLEADVATREIDNLQDEAMRDPLTGVWNRRRVMAVDATILDEPGAALALVDLDGFKQINDSLGHIRGDEVLRQVARALRWIARPTDVVARFGGDEFVVIRPAGERVSLADDLATVTRLEVAAADDAGAIPVTASIGVATSSGDGGWAATFSDADRAMYTAKRRGGGRIAVAG